MSQILVNAEILRDFVRQAIDRVVGESVEQSRIVANSLVWSDQIGRATHGVWRLPTYLQRLSLGLIKCPCQPLTYRVSDTAMRIDGDNGFGQFVGHVAMDEAIKNASVHGIGVSGVSNSNHFGVGAYFLNMAAEQGMIAVAMSNSVPKMAAHGGVKAIFGTNPFAFSAPMRDGRHLLVDMATSASSGSMIMKHIEQGSSLAHGIAVDSNGESITDPNKVSEGVLLPFGGAKGYGLALMVEILSGVITGACISHGVKSMYKDFENAGGNGHFFLALDLSKFMPLDDYFQRMDALKGLIKSSGQHEHAADRVLLPGEKRWDCLDRSLNDGVNLDISTQKALDDLCREYYLNPPW